MGLLTQDYFLERRARSAAKTVVLAAAYGVCLLATLLGTAVLAAFGS